MLRRPDTVSPPSRCCVNTYGADSPTAGARPPCSDAVVGKRGKTRSGGRRGGCTPAPGRGRRRPRLDALRCHACSGDGESLALRPATSCRQMPPPPARSLHHPATLGTIPMTRAPSLQPEAPSSGCRVVLPGAPSRAVDPGRGAPSPARTPCVGTKAQPCRGAPWGGQARGTFPGL